MSSLKDTTRNSSSQEEAILFLKSFAPTVIETHISIIFLDDKYAYKLKKALTLPFVDFSQSKQRHAYCLDELKLNRRTAPDLYLEVLPIYRAADGQLSFDNNGNGEVVESVLKMRRFDSRCLLSKLAEKKQLNSDMITELAHVIAGFHQHAKVSDDYQGAKRVSDIIELNRLSEPLVNKALGHQRMTALNLLLLKDTALHASLLNNRAANGKVRHCHGDLHLNNICLWHQTPTPFDCLEFNESMATTDVLYDLAFLLMDLWRYKQYDLANWLMNRYLDHNDESDGLALLPLFMSMRASIRAMVIAIQATNTDDTAEADNCRQQAEQFLDLAFNLLQRPKSQLLAIGGLSGSGKSTMASALAPFIGAAPGARVLSTDRIRKKLFGVTAEERLPSESYTEASSNLVYRTQRELSCSTLQAGHSVIADAVFSKEFERKAIESCAQQANICFKSLWLEAPAQELMDRVKTRKNDPSDATVAVVKKQLQMAPGEVHWPRLNSAQRQEDLVAQALNLLNGKWPW